MYVLCTAVRAPQELILYAFEINTTARKCALVVKMRDPLAAYMFYTL